MAENAIVVCTWSAGRDGLPEGAEEILHIGRGLAGALDKDLNWLVLGPLSPGASALAGQYGVAHLSKSRIPNSTPPVAMPAWRPSRPIGRSTIRAP
jgi:hypothetical protein